MRMLRSTIAVFATLALAAGTAAAGDPKPAPTKAPTATAQATPPVTAPKAVPAPATPAKTEPKAAPTPTPAPAPAATKTDPKAGPAAGAPAKPTEAKPPEAKPPEMEAPKPPAEVAEVAKQAVGTWRCQGNVYMPDGSSRPTTGIIRNKLDLDKFWIQGSLTETTPKTKFKYKFTSYTTYDALGKQWARVSVDNMGGRSMVTSPGPKDGVTTWEGTSHMMGMTHKSKDVETMVSPREIKMMGQASMDGGKTWKNGYEVTCKK